MSKVYLKEIRDAAEQHTVDVSRKQLSEALYHSPFREMPATLLDTRYRAVSEDIWAQIFEYLNGDTSEDASEHYDNDNFGHALAAFTRTKLDVNGVGLIVDTENRRSNVAVLLHDPQRAESKATKIALVERDDDGRYGIADPFTSDLYNAPEGFVLFS